MAKISHRIKRLAHATVDFHAENSDDFTTLSIKNVIGMKEKLSQKRHSLLDKSAENEKTLTDHKTLLAAWLKRVDRAAEFLGQADLSEQDFRTMEDMLKTAQAYVRTYELAIVLDETRANYFTENVGKINTVLGELIAFERNHQLQTSLRNLEAQISPGRNHMMDEQEMKELRSLTYTAKALIALKVEEFDRMKVEEQLGGGSNG